MRRLSRYLLGLFWADAMALFAIAAFLLFLIQCLRLFDAIAEKGQNLLTLLGEALLGMPALGTGFLYVCLGIGLGRALRTLHGASELQIIHVEGLLPALLRSVGAYIVMGAAVLLLLAHVVNPLAQRSLDGWSASIAADLVSRSMVPHRITAVADGVSMTIGARDGEGNISGFFADDHRAADTRRTYFARTAIITRDAQGFVLRMQDGAIQQTSAGGRLSQVSFARYDLALDALTGAPSTGDSLGETSSPELVAAALSSGTWTTDTLDALVRRSVEALRTVAICLLVTALAAFPSGERRRVEVPVELAVLGAAFLERAVDTYFAPAFAGPAPGALLLALAGAIILAARLRVFSPVERAAA